MGIHGSTRQVLTQCLCSARPCSRRREPQTPVQGALGDDGEQGLPRGAEGREDLKQDGRASGERPAHALPMTQQVHDGGSCPQASPALALPITGTIREVGRRRSNRWEAQDCPAPGLGCAVCHTASSCGNQSMRRPAELTRTYCHARRVV